MGDFSLEHINLLRERITTLQDTIEGLAEELRIKRTGVGFLPLKEAAALSPFGVKKLKSLWEENRIKGFLEPGRGRGAGELVIDMRSVAKYCETQTVKFSFEEEAREAAEILGAH